MVKQFRFNPGAARLYAITWTIAEKMHDAIWDGNDHTNMTFYAECLMLQIFSPGHFQEMASSAERKPREWDTGTMCKNRRFYRHSWIRYVV